MHWGWSAVWGRPSCCGCLSCGVCGGGEVVLFEEAGVYQMGEVFPLGILKGEGKGGSPGFFKDVLGLHPEQMEKLFKLELLF